MYTVLLLSFSTIAQGCHAHGHGYGHGHAHGHGYGHGHGHGIGKIFLIAYCTYIIIL